MKVLIFEDETLASDQIRSMLEEIDPEVEVLEVLKSVESATNWLEQHPEPDLIISDIQLLDSVAFDVFAQHKVSCPVIFTTAYDQYAIRAFEVNSIDYLLKPIQKEKLRQALDKLKSLSKGQSGLQEDQMQSLMELIKNQQREYKSRFMVRLGQKIKAISIEKIAYFFSKDKLTFLVSETGDKYPLDQSLEEVDDMLDPQKFFRANRQYIVKIDSVTAIHPYFKGRLKLELTPKSDDDIVISSEKTPLFKQWLDQ